MTARNISAATGTLQVLIETKGLDSVYYPVYDSTALGVSASKGGRPVSRWYIVAPSE